MDFLEKDLESILYETPADFIRERGLSSLYYHEIFRQVNLGCYGVADLITIFRRQKTILIDVYELKNKVLNPSAFWQIVKYIKAIKHITQTANLNNHEVIINGILIGRTIDTESDFCFLPSIESCIRIYTYCYDFNGIRFEYLSDSYIKTKFTGLNLSQFNSDSAAEFYRCFLLEPSALNFEILENGK